MLRLKLSGFLMVIVVMMAICGILIYLVVLPHIGQEVVATYPEFKDCYLSWLVFLWCTGIPCYIVLFLMWQILRSIRAGAAFTARNESRLKRISQCAAADAVILFAGNVILLLLGRNHPSIFLCCLGIVFAGITFSVVSLLLSHLTGRAAALQEEYDLTI